MKMKISLIVSWLLTFSIILCLCVSNCDREKNTIGSYVHPTFQTKYTKEEHVKRLTALVEDVYDEKIENGDIKSFTVEIVYAYHDYDPEYFLIEFDGFGKLGPWTADKAHLIGLIVNDVYTLNIPGYYPYWDITESGSFKIPLPLAGESPYKQLKLNNREKYFGGHVYGVFFWEEQKIVELTFDKETNSYAVGNEISSEREKELMRGSYPQAGRKEFRKKLV